MKYMKSKDNKLDKFGSFFYKEYEFKRGFDKIKTRRYTVKYKVNCYVS